MLPLHIVITDRENECCILYSKGILKVLLHSEDDSSKKTMV